jgi:(4S)-4-hydroxy-5-phosphonooxypentane-2,3-dione isomerase
MYVVTVEFEIAPEHRDAFITAVKKQAADSLTLEPDCHYFDVCLVERRGKEIVYLYELYTDRAAFDAHLASDHFIAFNEKVTPWTVEKIVGLGTLAQGTAQ